MPEVDPFQISEYEHVGIRVTDRARSIAFYEMLGFRVSSDLPEHRALIMTNAAGVTINLIYNGVSPPGGRNVLMDEGERYPGVTHPAFVVPSLDAAMQALKDRDVEVTEGPVVVEQRRICFCRDPDGNVIELDERL